MPSDRPRRAKNHEISRTGSITPEIHITLMLARLIPALLGATAEEISRRTFTYIFRRARLFPQRGDVIQFQHACTIKIRRQMSEDFSMGFMPAGSRWMVMSCDWEVSEHSDLVFPATTGRMTLLGYGTTAGLIEVSWDPTIRGSRGLVSGFMSLGPATRLFDAEGA